VLLAVACKPEATPTTSAGSVSPFAPPVEVSEADFDTIDATVKENKGKVVLIDMWATWCGPCRATFPQFGSLPKRFSEKGLVCISVSLDKTSPRPTYKPDEVLKFLKGNKATFRNVVLTGSTSKLSTRYGYEGYIPYKVMFDKTGNRIDVADMDEEE